MAGRLEPRTPALALLLPAVCTAALLMQEKASGPDPRARRPALLRLPDASLCGDGGGEEPAARGSAAWRRLARDSEERLARERSADALSEAALVRLAAGQPAEAIALLDESHLLRPSACTLVALSAAHLVAAEGDEEPPAHVLAALADAHRAAGLDPTLREAHANEARARERLGLRLSAAVARTRAGHGDPVFQKPIVGSVALRERAAARDWDGLARLAAVHRQDARLLGEEELLPRAAIEGGDALAGARVIGQALAGSGGDHLLADSVRSLEEAGGVRRERMAAGFARFRDGLERSQRDDWRGAASALGAAHALLRQADHPYTAAVVLHQAVASFYLADYAAALELIESGDGARRSPAVEGRADWLRGLVLLVHARPLQALEAHRRAARVFADLGERGHVAFLDTLLAGDLDAIHRPREAWARRREALLALDEVREPRRTYTILWDASRALLDEGRALEALLLLDELALRTGPETEPILRATVLLRRARVAHQLGDADGARRDVAAARAASAAVQGPFAARLDADADAVAGEVEAAADPARAVETLSLAVRQFQQSGHNPNVARLLGLRGEAHRRLGHFDEARADLAAVVDGYARYGPRLAADSERLAYLELATRAADALVGLHLDAGDPRRALDVLERLRLPAGAVRPASLPPGVTALAYGIVGGDLVTWVLRGSDVRVRHDRSAAAAVRADVVALERAVAAPHAAAAEPALARIAERLVTPFVATVPSGEALVVVPDKWLHRVPFAALPDPRGGVLLDHATVVVAPSLRSLTMESGPLGAPAQLLAAGAASARSASDLGLPPLPGVDRELAAVAALPGNWRVLGGAEATASRVLAALGEADLVHLAAHGVAVGPRAGLLFEPPSGAAIDDALLTSTAVERLHLRRRPVVVLTSCRSGGAGPDSARVPATLARAFLAAGARAVVATLWDTADDVAADMGTAVEGRIVRGAGVAEALREAQAELASRRPLRDWAGFYVLTSEVGRVRRPAAPAPRGGVQTAP